jgi:hypothetical protein
MNTALIQLFAKTGPFGGAVIFSDSISSIQSVATFHAPPSKMVTEIHSPIKFFKHVQKNIKFQCMVSTVVLQVMK